MALQGGGSLEWTRPIDPSDDVVGCHRGNHEALNIRNAQPGFQYYYVRATPSKVLQFQNRGWEVLTSDHPERWGAELPDIIQQQLGSVRAYQDVIPVRIPLEIYRRNRAMQDALARASREGPSEAYLEKSASRERQLAGRTGNRPVYFSRGDHGTHVQEY